MQKDAIGVRQQPSPAAWYTPVAWFLFRVARPPLPGQHVAVPAPRSFHYQSGCRMCSPSREPHIHSPQPAVAPLQAPQVAARGSRSPATPSRRLPAQPPAPPSTPASTRSHAHTTKRAPLPPLPHAATCTLDPSPLLIPKPALQLTSSGVPSGMGMGRPSASNVPSPDGCSAPGASRGPSSSSSSGRATNCCIQGHKPGMWVRGVHSAACACARRSAGQTGWRIHRARVRRTHAPLPR